MRVFKKELIGKLSVMDCKTAALALEYAMLSENAEGRTRKEIVSDLQSYDLDCLFIFKDTIEGHKFWWKINLSMKSQNQKVLEMLFLGHPIDLTMTKFTTRLAARISDLERMHGLNIKRGWRKLKRSQVRTYQLVK